MRVILGLDAPDAGTALIGGRPYRKLHPPLCHVGSLDHLVVVGRGKVIADTSVRDLLTRASGDRVELRTSARGEAMRVLARAGAKVTPSGPDTVTISGLPAERVVALLGGRAVPFSEVAAHRATLEEAYMELTHDAVEYRAERTAR